MSSEERERDVESASDERAKIDQRLKRSSTLYQTNALMRKSFLNQWRQYRTNLCQLLFPLMLIILLFLLQQLVDSLVENASGGAFTEAIPEPRTFPFTLLETNIALADDGPNPEDCPPFGRFAPPVNQADEFVFVDSTSGTGTQFMQNFTTYSEPIVLLKGLRFIFQGNRLDVCERRPFIVDPFEWREVPSIDALNREFYESYATTQRLGGVILHQLTETLLSYSVYFNQTLGRGNDIPVWLDLMGNTWLQKVSREREGNITEMVLDGYKDFPTKRSQTTFDLVSLIGPFLYIFVFQLIFPVILGSIVYEKENKLRDIMRMMGLKMGTYWVVTYIFSFLLYFVGFLALWIAAAALGFKYYTVNNPLILLLFFGMWGHVLVAFSFFFSVFFSKSRAATVVGYIWVFATGLLASQVISSFFASPDTPYGVTFILSCVPQFALFRGLNILSNAVAFRGPGLNWGNFISLQLGEVLLFLFFQWLIFLSLAVYLEMTLPIGYGVKRHPLFCFQKSFWKPSPVDSVLKESVKGEPEDVAAIREDLKANPDKYYLRVEDLHKVYPKSGSVPAKIAVKSLSLGVINGECFGFLGPNGAGKSTTLNVLSGLTRATSGTAYVENLPIDTATDTIHLMMGVCPQDNVLWDDLTAPEHLRFYGRLKNMRGKELDAAVLEVLKAVNLHEENRKKAKEFSGGMKRRLSVAIAFIGNPKLVLLDEPSTGLDPASRRQLWELINEKKKTCALLLTTHAMEEADALCDRLGIFAGGELKCVGPPNQLKTRFGKGLKLTLTCDPEYTDKVHEFVKEISPNSELLNSLAGTSNFELPKKDIKLSRLFSQLEKKKKKLHVTDWGISNTTLEEVFLKITSEEEKKVSAPVFDASVNSVELQEKTPKKSSKKSKKPSKEEIKLEESEESDNSSDEEKEEEKPKVVPAKESSEQSESSEEEKKEPSKAPETSDSSSESD